MCFTKLSSAINLIYAGQPLFSYTMSSALAVHLYEYTTISMKTGNVDFDFFWRDEEISALLSKMDWIGLL